MGKKYMPKNKSKTISVDTTIGELVNSMYETALSETQDHELAKRICIKFFKRKLRKDNEEPQQ